MTKTILWFSNIALSTSPCKSTGTWLGAMAEKLAEERSVRLTNISQAKVNKIVRQDCGPIRQYLIPHEPLKSNGLPSSTTIRAIQEMVTETKPDLTHIWGTENYWGLLTARNLLPGPAILDMQGLKFTCAKVYYGGLSTREILRCIGPLEILRPRCSLFFQKRNFERWGIYEKEIIKGHKFISTQSDWIRMHVKTINPVCRIFETGIILRNEFYDARPWNPSSKSEQEGPVIFTSSSGATAYKGLHVLLRSLAILKRNHPRIHLNIAGGQFQRGVRTNGYARWLKSEILRLKIAENISWLGPMTGEEIIRQLQNATVTVIPSFVESYSLALAETMLIGTPLVVSFAGAMPELAKDGESALFFTPGDEFSCTNQIEQILKDSCLGKKVSKNAIQIGTTRNDPVEILRKQLTIYNETLKHFTSTT